jgi:hypothetical protein
MRCSVGIVLVCVGLSVACDNSGDSSPIGSSQVTLTTETFTCTVQPTQSDSHPFTVVRAGEVDVTLTAAGPPPTITMGLGLGTPGTTSGTCTLQSGFTISTQAGTTPQLSGSTSAGGTFCVAVFDVGNQSAAVDYTLTVAHP